MNRGPRWRHLLNVPVVAVVLLAVLAIVLAAAGGNPLTAAPSSSAALRPEVAAQSRNADLFADALVPTPESAVATPFDTPTPLSTAETTQTPEPTFTAVSVHTAVPTASPRPPTRAAAMVRVPILMYHYIRVNPDPTDKLGFALSIPPQEFDRQVAYLADQGYQSVTLEQVAAALRGDAQLPSKPVALTFDDGYRDFYTDAFPVLQKYRMQATSFVITGFVEQPRYLTWKMIDELARSGLVEFGSHTVTHSSLNTLSLPRAQSEIQESKRILEAHLGTTIHSFCYPSGKYVQSTVTLVKDAGYEVAVTTNPGASHAASDILTLKRVRVDGRDGFAGFVARLRAP